MNSWQIVGIVGGAASPLLLLFIMLFKIAARTGLMSAGFETMQRDVSDMKPQVAKVLEIMAKLNADSDRIKRLEEWVDRHETSRA